MNFIKSKVFWTAVVIVAINSFPEVKQFIPGGAVDTISALLGLLATYFHVNDVTTIAHAVSQAQDSSSQES